MKKAYMMPQNNVVKTRIRASILAGSNGTVTNAGKVQESMTAGDTNSGGTQPQAQTIGGRNGFFGE